jgi:tetratricopeptide (TPR) repeat protein
MTRSIGIFLLSLTLSTAPVAAQQFTDSTLAQAVRLVTEGQGDSARALVRATLAGTDRADPLYPQALFAAGLVAEHLDSALAAFRRVGIEFSDSPWADDALLRIAQLTFAARDLPAAQRAADRVLSDYPLSDVRATAAYWSGRIRIEQGQIAEACPLLRQAEAEAGDDVELANRARYYLQRCSPHADSTATPGAVPGRAAFAVQVAAVGTAAAADEVMQRVHAAGYEPRVVQDGGLFKVRVGRFRTRADAQQAQADLRRKLGGSPFIVEESP